MRAGGSRRRRGPGWAGAWAAFLVAGLVAAGTAWADPAPDDPNRGATTEGAAPPAPKVLDLNQATADELTGLPGIGRKKAEAIVALRTRRPFSRPTQLLLVKGIGKKTLLKLLPLVRVGPPTDPKAHGAHETLEDGLKDRGASTGARAGGLPRKPLRPDIQPVGPGQGPPAP